MRKKLNRGLSVVFLSLPLQALALGVGEIETQSYLNQPFSAKIPLMDISTKDLDTVKVGLASSEVFRRSGLVLNPTIEQLQFELISDERTPFILVTSDSAIKEPMVTFLVEVSWGKGKIVREYTVLLDPPTVSAQPNTTAPVNPVVAAQTAPEADPAIMPDSVTASEPAISENITAEAPPAVNDDSSSQPTAMEVEVPVAEKMPVPPVVKAEKSITTLGEYGPVPRGDSLWAIARSSVRAMDDVSIHQAMVAIYKNNPRAFAGNMNLLKAGVVLRIPDAEEMTAVSDIRARSMVTEQASTWSAKVKKTDQTKQAQSEVPPLVDPAAKVEAAPAAKPEAAKPRLELVAPDDDMGDMITGAEDVAMADNPVNSADVAKPSVPANPIDPLSASAAGAELIKPSAETSAAAVGAAETQVSPLMAVINDDLAALQTQAASEPPAVEAPTAPTIQGDGSITEPMTMAVEPAVSAADPVAAVQPAPQAAAQADAPASSSTMMDRLLNPLVIGGVFAALLGGIFMFWRRKQQNQKSAEPEIRVGSEPQMQDDGMIVGEMPAAWGNEAKTASASSLAKMAVVQPESSSEDESAETDAAASAGTAPKSFGVDEEDSMAEADFNLSYGLHDEAIAAVEKGLSRDPSRRDLKLKRLEILFASGGNQKFLEYARAMSEESAGMADSYWDRAAVIGRQLFPEEMLFAGGRTAIKAAKIDIDFSNVEPAAAGTAGISIKSGAFANATEKPPSVESIDLNMDTGSSPASKSSAQPVNFETTGDASSTEDSSETKLDLAKAYIDMEEMQDARKLLDEVLTSGNPAQQNEANKLMSRISGAAAGVRTESTQLMQPISSDSVGGLDFKLDTSGIGGGKKGLDDVETKLDLAQAYLSMDDVEGAKNLINEVLEDGSQKQREQANALLAKIP